MPPIILPLPPIIPPMVLPPLRPVGAGHLVPGTNFEPKRLWAMVLTMAMTICMIHAGACGWRCTEQNAADEDDNEDCDGEDGRCDDATTMATMKMRIDACISTSMSYLIQPMLINKPPLLI